jgi:hypothetical protein
LCGLPFFDQLLCQFADRLRHGAARMAHHQWHAAIYAQAGKGLVIGYCMMYANMQPLLNIAPRDSTADRSAVDHQPNLLLRMTAACQLVKHQTGVAQPHHLRQNGHHNAVRGVQKAIRRLIQG